MAPPNLTGSAAGLLLAETQVISEPKKSTQRYVKPKVQTQPQEEDPYKWRIVWRNVFAFIYLHTATVYGLYLGLTVAKWSTVLWTLFVALLGSMGITAGAHRLWAHRSYKAKWPLRLFLAICQTMAFQNHIYEWVRDHRVHHKFTDTDADPHNSKRGFFFSHMGWLMVRKHKDVTLKGKTIDLSDLEADWIVMAQKKIYMVVLPLFSFFIPALVPWYYWGESGVISWNLCAIARYTLSLNATWMVNSWAHIWGMRPYDRFISPTDSLTVAIIAFGEGWHNYHHSFPWDYKTSELGDYAYNFTTGFIDLMAKIGWAYDLKTAPAHMILRRAMRKGDGSYKIPKDATVDDGPRVERQEEIWGWGDNAMPKEEQDLVEITHRKED